MAKTFTAPPHRDPGAMAGARVSFPAQDSAIFVKVAQHFYCMNDCCDKIAAIA